MMRKVIVEEWLSLDGYAADRNGQLAFFAKMVRQSYVLPGRMDFLKRIDSILFGRQTYQQFAELWPDREVTSDPLAHMINHSEKIVFSNTLKTAPWGTWSAVEISRGDAAEAVRQLKSQPGKDMVVWGSISLAQILLKENLVDELHLHICPTITAGGRRFFTPETTPGTLTLTEAKPYGEGAVFLVYKIK